MESPIRRKSANLIKISWGWGRRTLALAKSKARWWCSSQAPMYHSKEEVLELFLESLGYPDFPAAPELETNTVKFPHAIDPPVPCSSILWIGDQ